MEKPVPILFLAHNEERHIQRAIAAVRATKVSSPIFVVDDGSTDRTAELARKMGVSVLSLKANYRKAGAFFAGVRWLNRLGYPGLVVLDADLLEVPARSLSVLIAHVEQANRKKWTRMIVAHHIEGDSPTGSMFYSGSRAFSSQAVGRILVSKSKRFVEGYGLETYLNYFFTPHESVETKAYFRYDVAFRKPHSMEQQEEDFARVSDKNDSITRDRLGRLPSFRQRKEARKRKLARISQRKRSR